MRKHVKITVLIATELSAGVLKSTVLGAVEKLLLPGEELIYVGTETHDVTIEAEV